MFLPSELPPPFAPEPRDQMRQDTMNMQLRSAAEAADVSAASMPLNVSAALADAVLAPEEQEWFEEAHYLVFLGKDDRTVYQIWNNGHVCIYSGATPCGEVVLILDETIPPGKLPIVHKRLLEQDEAAYLRVARCVPWAEQQDLDLPGSFDPPAAWLVDREQCKEGEEESTALS